MKCAQCRDGGAKSSVHSLGRTTTLMAGGAPFWDEDGVMHVHDPNKVTRVYRCSNGHEWSDTSTPKCPASGCGYGQQEGLE